MKRALVRVVSAVVSFVFFGSGCEAVQKAVSPIQLVPPTHPAANSETQVVWNSRAAGIDRAQFAFSSSTASAVIVYRFALKDYALAFQHATSAAISDWQKQLSNAQFVLNGVYFHAEQLPSGWFKSKEQVIGKRSFDVDKSALLTLQPKVDILAAPEEQKKAKTQSSEAAQSFPLLVSNGLTSIKTDSGKASRRTFIGIDQSRTYVYIGIVPYMSISLYELSQALVRLPVPWDMVLNLDGGPSSGIAFRDQTSPELIDSYVTIPNVIVVTPKP